MTCTKGVRPPAQRPGLFAKAREKSWYGDIHLEKLMQGLEVLENVALVIMYRGWVMVHQLQ